MSIADDWDFDYANKVLSHIDGVLSYDTGGGRQAAVGEYIRGDNSGAVGKILAVTGSTATGTLTLTNVVGFFEDNEGLEVLSRMDFDNVTAGNGGFKIGDTIVDQSIGTILARAIEYNNGAVLGEGSVYGTAFGAYTNNQQLDISGGQADVADVNGGGTDNSGALTTTQTDGTLALPGTADTNDCVIVHYDAGTVQIPDQAIVEDATSGAIGLVEQVYGIIATGSVRIVDYNSTGGAWGDNNTLRADQVIAYNNQVAGQVFTAGDVVVGLTSGATGRVLLDTGTELILADESGTWTTTEDLRVGGVKIAEANGSNTTLNLATLNLPDGVRSEQRADGVAGNAAQGGIYDIADSLNIVRKFNSLYTLSQDTFDELLQMDDDEALDASVKGGAYSLVFDWFMPELSVRFLRQGGLSDTTGANVWANPQTVGAQDKITDTAYLYDTTNPFHQPQLYIEQNGSKIPTHWLEGNIDVLVKVRSRNDVKIIDPTVPALGQLVVGGDPQLGGSYTVFNREFHTSTFDATQFNAPGGGVNTVALGTAGDTASDRNPNSTHTFAYDAGSAATLEVGEQFTAGAGNGLKVGQVVAQTGDAGASGTVNYVLRSGAQFGDNESCTAEVSGKTFDVDETGGFDSTNDVVAGYGADIRFQVVDLTATPSGGTGITGTFIPGEGVTQAVTAATGFLVLADTANDLLHIETVSGTFSGDNDITGDTSSASWDAGTGATYPSDTDFLADLNDGSGAEQYTGSVGGDITNTNPRTVQDIYEYIKYVTRAEEETAIINGPGTADLGTVGGLFRKQADAFAEVKPGAPIGTFTGNLSLAQGWFLDSAFIAAADIRSFNVINNAGILRNPPNLQALTISGVAAGWRVAAYRSTGSGATAILRTEFDVGTIGGGNNQAADSTVLVGANTRSVGPLPADVPDSGVLLVLSPNDTGNYIHMTYSSVNRTTNIFTLTGTIGSFLTAAGETSTDLVINDNAHVSFIEEQSGGTTVTNTLQYVADIDVVYKARLKGFKPFRATGVFGSGGVVLGVVQNADTIVDLP